MKLKRIVTSISAGLDDLIGKLENHQAVAECAIAELSRTAASIRQQLQAAKNQQQIQQQSLAHFTDEIELWQQRAKDSAPTNKEKALRCVNELQNARTQVQTVERQLEQTAALVRQLQTYLTDVEGRLAQLHHKKAALRAREAHNRSSSVTSDACAHVPADDVFSRWETAIAAEEYARGTGFEAADDLSRAFAEAETRQALEAELELLLNNPEQEQGK